MKTQNMEALMNHIRDCWVLRILLLESQNIKEYHTNEDKTLN